MLTWLAGPAARRRVAEEAAAAVIERLGGAGSADDCARALLEVTEAWP
jgi:hypothetical protein